MNPKYSLCVNQERDFQLHELFFSITDRQGVIQYGNAVFTRISGYAEDELIGFAHSRVRHPDMPACVFKLFWQMLEAGQSIAAYVKNRAKDGSYYWVMAVATQSQGGYLSVRLKPSSELFEVVQQVYADVLAIEQTAIAEGLSKREAMDLGLAGLLESIAELGFADYPSFMRHALSTEMISRHHELSETDASDRQRRSRDLNSDDTPLAELAQINQHCDVLLSGMLERLAALTTASNSIESINQAMLCQLESISMVALNAKLAADTRPLEAISNALAVAAMENSEMIEGMNKSVRKLATSLAQLAFDVAIAALYGEVSSQFLREIRLGDEQKVHQLAEHVRMLVIESQTRYTQLFTHMNSANNWFAELERLTDRLHRNAKSIRFVRMAGVKEAAHLVTEHTFRGLFADINQHIVGSLSQCSELRVQVHRAKSVVAIVNQTKSSLGEQSQALRRSCDRLPVPA